MKLHKLLPLFIVALFISGVWGVWNINKELHPPSADGKFLVFANITDSQSRIVSPSNCAQYSISYTYNGSKALNPLSNNLNIWYSLENYQTSTSIPINTSGTCYGVTDSGSTSTSVNSSNIIVKTINDFSVDIPRGKTVELKINATQNGFPLSNAQASYTMLKQDGTRTNAAINFNPTSSLFEANVTLPSDLGKVLFWVDITSGNSTGGDAAVLNLVENLEGSIVMKNSESKCDTEVSNCEPEASVLLNFTETVGEPDTVKLTVENNDQVLLEKNLTNITSGIWNTNFSVPKNVSQVKVKVSAVNNATNFLWEKNLLVTPYTLNILKKSSISPGEDLDIDLELFKPFSGGHLQNEDIKNLNLSIMNSSNYLLKSFVKDDFAFINDVFKVTYKIPVDAQEGDYIISIKVLDNDNYLSTENSSYKVSKKLSSGPLLINVSLIAKEFTEQGVFYQSILYNNTDTSSVVVQTYITGNVSNITLGDVVHSEDDHEKSILIPSQSTKTLQIGFNITELLQYYEGIIVIKAFTNLETTKEKFRGGIPVKINVLVLNKNGSVGATPGEINEESIIGTFSKDIQVYNLGNASSDFQISLEGDITNFATLSLSNFNLESGQSRSILLNYQISSTTIAGIYTGKVRIKNNLDVLEIPVTINVNTASVFGKFSISILESFDLGEVVSGETISRTINITNTGSVELGSFSVISESSPVSIEGLSTLTLNSGESFTSELNINTENAAIEGQFSIPVRITASPNAEEVLNFQIFVFNNYEEKFNQLITELTSLKAKASSGKANVSANIERIETLIDDGKSLFSQKRYTEAKNKFDEATSLKRIVERQIDESTSMPTTPEVGEKKSNGIIIFLIIFVVLAIAGIIIYLSIVPDH